MKVILATGIFPPDIGGPATYVEKLAIELSQRNFDIKVITYSDGLNPKSAVAKSDSPEGCIRNPKLKVIRISRKYPKGIRHFLYFLNLLKLAKDYDVIYAQDVVSAGLPAFLASKILKKKLVVKIVGDYAWEKGKREKIVKETLEDFQKRKYNLQIEFLRKIQKLVAKKADKIITPSQYLKKIVAGWQVPKEKIEVIYNAPEISFRVEISKKEAKKKIGIFGDILLSIGRLVPWKGFGALIEIMPDFLKENPNFQLVIIGEGPEEKNLKSQISNLKIENRVKLLGKILHKEIPLYFRAADLFVLNTGYEGLSHVILEAMQAGVPIITTNVGGNPELIKNNHNGILVKYNNKNQLKDAILKLWKNKNLQKKFIQNSQKKIKEFSWENLVERTLKVFKSI